MWGKSGRDRQGRNFSSTIPREETMPEWSGRLKTMFGEVWDLEVPGSCQEVLVKLEVWGQFSAIQLGAWRDTTFQASEISE